MSENDNPTGNPTLARHGWRKATPYVAVAAYIVGPLLLIPAFGGDAAVIPVIIFIFAAAAIAGFVDGATYRFTWSLPILVGVGFFIAKALYFNDGTFIYGLGCVAVAAAAGGLGAGVGKHHAPGREV